MVPCCNSGGKALILLSFVDAWSMVEQPIMFITDVSPTAPVRVPSAGVGRDNMALGFACSVVFIIPVVVPAAVF
jgi:multiple sugar transport system permease protein